MKKINRAQLRKLVEGAMNEDARPQEGWTKHGHSWENVGREIYLDVDIPQGAEYGVTVVLDPADVEALAFALGLL